MHGVNVPECSHVYYCTPFQNNKAHTVTVTSFSWNHKLYQAIQKWRQEHNDQDVAVKLECELQEGGRKERWGGKKGEGEEDSTLVFILQS